MAEARYERTFSIGSVSTEGESQEGVDRRGVEQRILIRRRAVILVIGTVFCVTTAIMVISVVHDEMNKQHLGYQELVCKEADVECFQMMCPQGWEWVQEEKLCQLREGEDRCGSLEFLTSVSSNIIIKV